MNIRERKLITKRNIVVVSALLAFIIVTFTILYISGIRQLEANARQADRVNDELQASLKSLRAAKTTENRKTLLEKMSQVSAMSCATETFSGWMYFATNTDDELRVRCESAALKARTLSKKASALATYLKEEQSIILVLSSLKIDKTKSDWQSQAASATEKAGGSMRSLTTNTPARNVKSVAVERIKAIAEAWKALNVASEKQDRTAYESAQLALSSAYARLSEITNASDKEVTILVKALKA